MIYLTLINIAIFQGIILGLIILRSPLFNSTSNKYLAYSIFTLSLLLLNFVFEIGGAFSSVPFLEFIDDIEWAFILPVFIFLFIINKVNNPVKRQKKLLWLYAPFGYAAVINIIIDLDTVTGMYHIPNSVITLINILKQIELFLVLTFIPFVLLYAYSFIKYSKDSNEKRWLFILWLIVSILLFSWVISIIAAVFFIYDISYIMRILPLFATFLIHWIAYIGIYKYKLAKDKEGIKILLNNGLLSAYSILPTVSSNKKEENKELLTSDNLYFQKLELLCRNNHIYTDSTLNREKIAEELGISAGYVSQLINAITGDNFANYINQYRVEAVKEMILNSEYENYNLLAIGLESGFTSKTTFYKAFKKVTGQTPNEYRNSNK